MKGIVFDRNRAGASPNEWDGQFAIAALDSPGVEVSYQTTFQAAGDGHAVWEPFSKDGRLANDAKSWVSDKEKLAGAIAVRFTLKPGESKVIPIVIAWDFLSCTRRRPQMGPPLHRFLRHIRNQRLEHRPRRTPARRRLEQPDRQMASALRQ